LKIFHEIKNIFTFTPRESTLKNKTVIVDSYRKRLKQNKKHFTFTPRESTLKNKTVIVDSYSGDRK
jgi:hypothetical protein